MADAAYGVAMREPNKPLELPFTFGLYDFYNKKMVIRKSLKKEELKIDRFHLYHLGTVTISQVHGAHMLHWKVSILLVFRIKNGNCMFLLNLRDRITIKKAKRRKIMSGWIGLYWLKNDIVNCKIRIHAVSYSHEYGFYNTEDGSFRH